MIETIQEGQPKTPFLGFGDRVRIDLVLPYPGRQTWFGWFAERIEEQIRQRMPQVGGVDVRQVSAPAWTPAHMNARAHRLLGQD